VAAFSTGLVAPWISRWLRLVATGAGKHDCCRPKACDCVLSCLAVRAVLLRVAALMQAAQAPDVRVKREALRGEAAPLRL